MPVLPPIHAAAIALLCCSMAPAQEPAVGHRPLQYIGYDHDGSGVYPDCTPVTTWNEWDFRQEEEHYEQKGKTKTRRYEVPDRENHQNIIYKVPHYNWCNGGMIIVGGKLYALSDRGGLGFYVERPAEFASVELWCFDPASGEELWRKDLDHWDMVPGGAAMRSKVLAYNQKQTEVMNRYMPIGYAMRSRSGQGSYLTPEFYLEHAEPLRALIPDLPATLDDIKGHLIDNTGYEQLHFFKKVQPHYWPDLAEARKEIQSLGYMEDPWAGKYDYLGISMQTPVSDGEHIWINTAFGAIYCVDLAGDIVWKRWCNGGLTRAQAIPSPILAAAKAGGEPDLLIITAHDPDAGLNKGKAVRMALDKATGKEVWRMPAGGGYQTGPVALELPVAGDAARVLPVLYYPGNGVVLRTADGKQIGDGFPGSGTGRPPAVDGDIIVSINKVADGGHSGEKNPLEKGWCAVRAVARSVDEVVAETLWQERDWGWSTVVANDGVVFHLGKKEVATYDIRSGEQIAKAGNRTESFHYTVLVGEYLMGLDMAGRSPVVRVSRDGKQIQPIAVNRLGDQVYRQKSAENHLKLWDRFSYGCQPFFSGNRVFIRSQTHLYCIGDPKTKMTLSPHHR